MRHQTFNELLEKHLNESADAEEKQQLAAMLEEPYYRSLLDQTVLEQLSSGVYRFELDAITRNAINQSIYQKTAASNDLSENPAFHPAQRIPLYRRWWAAASVILALCIGAYIWNANKKNAESPIVVAKTVDIAPGEDGAILTLSDGRQIVLDSLGNGVIALQNGSQAVIKNGELIYDLTGDATGEIVYNTMSTPKRRQFRLLLPDGTKVWLNAASSISYPTVFTGKERRVEITGEAYFEVAKNIKMPFRASVKNKAEIEVLGTHFNVNAYENEASINTTLLEGSVVVSSDQQQKVKQTVVLKPGQQAQLTNVKYGSEKAATTKTAIKIISDTDIEKVMAWRNGLFNFEDATLEEIMRQLERWYDIEVVYEKNVPNIALTGELTRGVTLKGLLPALGKMGVNYRLEGRKLTILP